MDCVRACLTPASLLPSHGWQTNVSFTSYLCFRLRGSRLLAVSGGPNPFCRPRIVPLASVAFTGVVEESVAAPSTQELQNEFGSEGVRFVEVAGLTVVELKLKNGASARMVLSSAQITSYKPLMWHGGNEELLHTALEQEEEDEPDVSPQIRGGIGLLFSREDGAAGSLISLTGKQSWKVDDVFCDPQKCAQVMISCHQRWISSNQEAEEDAALSLGYVVTLSPTALTSELLVFNSGLVPAGFTGAIANHIRLNTVEGAFGMGLQGKLYQTHSFPADQSWPRLWGIRGEERAHQMADSWQDEKEQDVKLQIGMNKIYQDTSECAILDRGKRRMVVIQAMGFKDFQISNPGVQTQAGFLQFQHNKWDEFICLGPAQAYQPVVLSPGERWRAGQALLHN